MSIYRGPENSFEVDKSKFNISPISANFSWIVEG